MLFELVYSSIASLPETGEEELDKILVSSRTNNFRLGITGVLLFHRGEFLQLLEGEREAVEGLYHGAIVSDRRHRSPLLCWDAPVAHRSFAQWSMGFARPTGLDPAKTPGLEGYLAGGLQGLDLSGPHSIGRRLLQSIHGQLLATP